MARVEIDDPNTWVDEYGDYLFRYAQLMLRDAEGAEDAVQETFLAVLAARKSFSGRSSTKTWLVGILKHKIADQFRFRQFQRPSSHSPSQAPSFSAFISTIISSRTVTRIP